MTISEKFIGGDILTVAATGATTGSSGLNFFSKQININERNIGSLGVNLSGIAFNTGNIGFSGPGLFKIFHNTGFIHSSGISAANTIIGSVSFAAGDLTGSELLHINIFAVGSNALADTGILGGGHINFYVSGVNFEFGNFAGQDAFLNNANSGGQVALADFYMIQHPTLGSKVIVGGWGVRAQDTGIFSLKSDVDNIRPGFMSGAWMFAIRCGSTRVQFDYSIQTWKAGR